jgi:AcrR family transcriptional regulator
MVDESPSVRERILEAARELFLRNGYNGSNLRDIARAASVSMGGIYHHFASKEEIYEALLPRTNLAREMPRVAALFDLAQFPYNLADIGRAIMSLVREHKDDFKLVYIDILEFQGRNVKPIIDALHAAYANHSQQLISHRVEAGELADVHPVVVTRLVLDVFLHLYLEDVMLGKSLADQIGLTDDEMADQMADLLLHGILRGPRTGPE